MSRPTPINTTAIRLRMRRGESPPSALAMTLREFSWGRASQPIRYRNGPAPPRNVNTMKAILTITESIPK